MKSEDFTKNSSSKNFENKLNQLCSILNYNFKNKMYLVEALTRQSAVIERHPNASPNNYQRLEFLGDSILNLCISDFIFELFPDKKEEDLHPLRSFIIKNETLAGFAEKLKFGSYLILGKGEEFQNIRKNKKILADIIEAIIGAVFIDSGRDYMLTKNVLIKFFKPLFFQDKNFKQYTKELNAYFEKINRLDNNDVSYVLDQLNSEDRLSEKNSSFCDLINLKSIPIIPNTNKNNSPSEFVEIIQSNFNPLNIMSNSFSNINEHKCNCSCNSIIENKISQFNNNNNILSSNFFQTEINISDLANLFFSSEKYEIEEKLNNLCNNKINSNHFLDFELLYINSNENFSVLLKNNFSTVEQVINLLMNKIKISHENLEIKQHFFASKFLLNIIINLGNEISDLYIKSIFCLVHNGIAEFRRRNYLMSKNYLEQGFETISLVETEVDFKLSEEFYDCKYLCIIYFSEIDFLDLNIEGHNKYFHMAQSINFLNTTSELILMQIRKIYLKNFILNNLNSYEKIDELIVNFSNQMNKLSEGAKLSRIFREEHINLKIIKFRFNKNLKDFSELKELEESLTKNYGKDSYLIYHILEFYVKKLQDEILNNSIENKNFQLIEKMAIYSHRIMKILFQNFTVNSKIFCDQLAFYNKSLDNYSNFNN
jgi:ribonuclease III